MSEVATRGTSAVVCVAIAIAACHDAKPAHEGPRVQAARIDVTDPLALLPADSDVVFTLDLPSLRRSPLWAEYGHDALTLVAPGFGECRYDPIADITTITGGIPGDDRAEGIFVIRGIDRDKTLDCLRTSKAATDTTVAFDGELVTLTNKSGAINLVTFVDPHTMVMQGSTHPTKETMAAALKVGAPLRHDSAYLAAASKLPHGSAVSFVMRPGSRRMAAKLEAKIGFGVTGFACALDVVAGLELHTILELASADDARSVVDAARPRLAAAKAYIDHFDVRAEGAAVHVDVAVTEAQLRAIIGIVKSAMAAAAPPK